MVKDKSLIISDQRCKIKTLTSRNKSLNLLFREKCTKFRWLSKRIAVQTGEIKKYKKEIQVMVKDLQGNALKDIRLFGSYHAANADRLKNKLRFQAENAERDITELGGAVRKRSEKVEELSSQLRKIKLLLQDKEKIVQVLNQKLQAQATLNKCLVSKIKNLWNDVHNKEKKL